MKNSSGKVLLEIPLSYGAIGAAVGVTLAPVLAAVGALAAVMTSCTIVVEKAKKDGNGKDTEG